MPKDPRIINSTGSLKLFTIPEKMLIIGGGIIGLEVATIYLALGSKITIVECQEQLLPGADEDLLKPLYKFEVMLKAKAEKVEAKENGLLLKFVGSDVIQIFDCVLVAIGRQPNGKVIGAMKLLGYLPKHFWELLRICFSATPNIDFIYISLI
jgi:dihydrolipoamide dehydrogenase